MKRHAGIHLNRYATQSYQSILFLCLVLLGSCNAQPKTESYRIEKQVVRSVDVTGDGIEDAITLYVRGETPTKPFFWTLTIRSEGREIFKFDGDGKIGRASCRERVWSAVTA